MPGAACAGSLLRLCRLCDADVHEHAQGCAPEGRSAAASAAARRASSAAVLPKVSYSFVVCAGQRASMSAPAEVMRHGLLGGRHNSAGSACWSWETKTPHR